MFDHFKESLRRAARNYCFSPNTIRYRIEYRAVCTLLKQIDTPLASLVDLGAGAGEMSARLMEDGYAKTIIGVEPDPNNFRLLERRYSSLKNSRCINRTIEASDIEPESIDAVMSTQVLEHIVDDVSAAKAIAHIIKPGGYAMISVPHPPELFPNPGHVRPGYTKEDLTTLFNPLHLQLVSYEYFLVIPTLKRLIAAGELGRLGYLIPLSWVDREAKMDRDEKATLQPGAIACLFKRSLSR
jgi:2-polyprenyl-3-methyl-5-hydroxy-6-metoxy-1,4-benzoquinol methylase